jgi:hypothetical protein
VPKFSSNKLCFLFFLLFYYRVLSLLPFHIFLILFHWYDFQTSSPISVLGRPEAQNWLQFLTLCLPFHICLSRTGSMISEKRFHECFPSPLSFFFQSLRCLLLFFCPGQTIIRDFPSTFYLSFFPTPTERS